MQQADIEVGKEYALREPVRAGVDFQHIKVLERVRSGRWRVEWIEPNPGLTDYVKSNNLVVPWKQRRAFLRDEERHSVLVAVAERQWDGPDGPVTDAVNEVFAASGEDLAVWRHGELECDPVAIARLAERAGVELATDPSSYTDRRGQLHVPFETALVVARAFAAIEPNTVLLHIDVAERQSEVEAREPGYSYRVPLLNRYRASWALVRQWAGHDAAIAAREKEISDLRQLLSRTVWDLRRESADTEAIANRLDRALRGR